MTIDMYEEVYELWKRAGIGLGWSDSKEGIKRMLERNPSMCFVLKDSEKDKIVGVVHGGFDGRRGYVHHLAVDPDYQKQGLGRKLMNALMKRFLDMQVHKVHLFIDMHNKKVVDFYKKLGWFVRDDLIMMSYDLKEAYPELYRD